MKLHLPLAMLAAVLSSAVYADISYTYNGESAPSDADFGKGIYNGHISATVTGDCTETDLDGTAHDSYQKGNVSAIAPALKDSKGNDINAAASTELIVTGQDTKVNKIIGGGPNGYAVTGDKTTTVTDGATAEMIYGAYGDFSGQHVEGLTIPGAPSSYYGTATFAPKAEQKADGTYPVITINVQNGAHIKNAVYGGSYLSQTRIGAELKSLTQKFNGDKTAAENSIYKGADAYSPWALNEEIRININNATVGGSIIGGGMVGSSVNNKVSITLEGDATQVSSIYGGAAGGTLTDDKVSYNVGAYVNSTHITLSGGTVKNHVFGGGYYNGIQTIVKGDTVVEINGGTVQGTVYGGGDRDIVEGNTEVTINGGEVKGNVLAAGASDANVNSVVEKNATVRLQAGTVSGEIKGCADNVQGTSQFIVGSKEQGYIGTVSNVTGFDTLTVLGGSSLTITNGNAFDCKVQSITLSALNLDEAAINCATADLDGKLTLNLNKKGYLKNGQYKVITSDAEQTGWSEENVTVTGIGKYTDLEWIDNTLYLTYRGAEAEVLPATAWGAFKSSQAFTGTLWGPRPATSCIALPGEPNWKAWGSVYSHSSQIDNNGADYSLYGGALGVEKNLPAQRLIGAALGYDWGKVKPCHYTAVKQSSFHIAAYGRADLWCPNSTDTVSIDWSAAYGQTSSDHADIPGEWTQNSLQLDARATYYRAISDLTTIHAFAGLQYYTQDSGSVSYSKIKAMQNLRFMLGGGISYKLTEKSNLYAEVSLYQDLDRHNPSVTVDGTRFHCANPGRFGGTVGAGVDYKLNKHWSLRAHYNFSTADNQSEHYIGVGASYSF